MRRRTPLLLIAAMVATIAPDVGVPARADTLGYVGTVAVPADDPAGVTLEEPLIGGETYVFVATGTYSFGPAGVADVECSEAYADPLPRRDRYGAETLDLLIGGYAHEWIPVDGYYGELVAGQDPTVVETVGCSPTHTYRYSVVAPAGYVNFRISDIYHGDNFGFVTVSVYRVLGGGAPPNDFDILTVNSNDSDGTVGRMPLQKGASYTFTVHGRYTYDMARSEADAECSTGTNDFVFRRERFGPSRLDLTINGYPVEWSAAGARVASTGCDRTSTYQLTLTALETGLATFAISDDKYSDNSGSLLVTVFRR